MQTFYLYPSENKLKKYAILIPGNDLRNQKIINFGAAGYEDYTTHKDPDRKKLYIKRHKNETWTKSNIESPAFWARWLLWNKPTINKSIADIENRFNIKIHKL